METKDCCPMFVAAQLAGTDNEGYEALIYSNPPGWKIGSALPNMRFCPWCGTKLKEGDGPDERSKRSNFDR